jgi:hypothetical protein|uniref:Uncharacterized protein n=1 Tax=Podoviridae sp. ctiuS14 TaxID=2827620 RepID=A0A8S5LMA3_9CAUD|nr:MAG TPA: hypothetical protein [Podoviridae sp. ctiuS14]
MGLREEIQNLLNQTSTQRFKVYMNGSLLETAQPKTEAEVGDIVEAIASNGVEVRIAVTDMENNTILDQVFNAKEEQENTGTVIKIVISAEGVDSEQRIEDLKELVKEYCGDMLGNVTLNIFKSSNTTEIYIQTL